MSPRARLSGPGLTGPKSGRPWYLARWTWLAAILAIAVGVLAAITGVRNPVLHAGSQLTGFLPEAAAVAIFAMTYLVVAIGRLPGFQLDRAGAALVGASLIVAVGALPLEDVPKAIYLNMDDLREHKKEALRRAA